MWIKSSELKSRGYKRLKKGFWFDYGHNFIRVLRQRDGAYKEMGLDGTGWRDGCHSDWRDRAEILKNDQDISWRK